MLRLAALLLMAFGAPAPELWFYCSTNLLVDENVDRLAALFERAGKAGYAKVLLADSKFARLGTLDARYFRNAERVKEAARRAGITIVPAICPIGYSEALLFHDPNLAEALPVKDAPFVVKGGRATIVAGGNLLAVREWPEWPEWKDELWSSESGGWRCRDPGGRNARVVFRVKVAPHRQYHVAVTIETKEFDGDPRVQVLVGGEGLSFSDLGCRPTQPPTRHHVVFNSLGHDEVFVYFGAWGAGHGELSISDPRLELVALVNLVRREGAPFEVRRADGSTLQKLTEGRDFEPVADPGMGRSPWPGAFDVWHEPPAIRTKLKDGTKLLVSYHHAITVGDGQVMICPSEPRTLDLIKEEARRVHDLFGGHEMFLSHDEIRVLDQDEACRRRGLDAGALLADHVGACVKTVRDVDPGAKLWIWSDMFDPSHNAHAGYYLVRGDLAGSWEGLDRSVGIANWNFERRDESLAFFAGRGHRQLVAGYYDGPVESIGAWLTSAAAVKGVDAVMYTTWQSRYDELERFAELVRAGERARR